MTTIAQELQSIEDDLKIILPHGEARKLYARRSQLLESVYAVKTWDVGSQHKRIINGWGLIGQGQTDWVRNQMGHPDLFREEELTLSWADVFEWPFVKVTLTNSQDHDDCFKYNSERMEAP